MVGNMLWLVFITEFSLRNLSNDLASTKHEAQAQVLDMPQT